MAQPLFQEPELSEYCANALRTAIRLRKTSMRILSDETGIPYRTLQGYTNGRVSLRNAEAANILDIADALNINPYILIGEVSIDAFYKEVQQEEYQKTKKRFEDKSWIPSKQGGI